MNEIRGVSLRSVLRGDLPLILQLFGDSDRAHLWGQRRVCDEEQLLETWRVWSGQRIGAKFIVLRLGRPVGLVFDYERVLEDGHTKIVTLLLDHELARGAGAIATALFAEWLFQNVPLRKVCFDVFAFNTAVVRMLQKLNVRQEMQREHRYWNDRHWDQLGFAIGRDELAGLMARFTRRRQAETSSQPQPFALAQRQQEPHAEWQGSARPMPAQKIIVPLLERGSAPRSAAGGVVLTTPEQTNDAALTALLYG